jgi:hypothetical protein
MSDETTLLGCPFCPGGNPHVVLQTGGGVVRCRDCGAQSGLVWRQQRSDGALTAELVAKWNTRGGFGHTRIAHVNPKLPPDTFKYTERLREAIERIEKGEMGEVSRGVLLSMGGDRRMNVTELRTGYLEVNDMAAALVSYLQASNKVQKL